MSIASATAERLIAEGRTREEFWNFPPWLEALWYVLAVVSVLVFAYGVARPVLKYRARKGDRGPYREPLSKRLRRALATTASQSSLRRRKGVVGWAHTGIFYGFVTLFLGTVVLGINTDLTEPLFGWRFFTGDFYLGYSLVLDVLGLALLTGLLVMMVRRAVVRPPELDYRRPDRDPDSPEQRRTSYRWGDWVFVGGLLYLMVTGYALEGVRMAMDRPGLSEYNPVGWLFSQPFLAVGETGLEVIRMTMWWSHGLVAIALVAAIPYTKAMHMLTSFAALVMRDPMAGRRLAPIPAERRGEPAGYGVLEDFSLKHLVDLDACTKCGRCHVACPANATGQPLSPRDVVLELREQANDAFADVGVGGLLGSLLRKPAAHPLDVAAIGPNAVREETIWACMQCNACVEACPVGIEQAPIINHLRRRLVEEGAVPAKLQATLRAVAKSGNSFGENRRRRGRWTQELDFEVKDARTEPVDVLWFVGDYASFDPRSQRVSRSVARLLHRAGVDFGILYDGERTAGNDVRRVGEEGLWESLAEENAAVLEECDFQRIMTTDPHSLNTLRNEYPDIGGVWTVVHHTSVLLDLITSGTLAVDALPYSVTYHDPCYLGRHNGEYDDPRRILELLGCTLVEMGRNRSNSFCCGAGGGRIWSGDDPGAERPSENRIREAVELGKLDYFVVACPKDVTMFEDAIKTSGNDARLELREITELIEEAVGGPPPSR